MTPAARVQTAIELLEPILAGAPAEKTLTAWARASRFAGSKDRAAVRDHVYDVLRRKNSCFQAGGDQTARAAMLGLLRLQEVDLTAIFSGANYAPETLSTAEMVAPERHDVLDLPAWCLPELEAALGEDFREVAETLSERAPVILRCNLRKSAPAATQIALREEGIETTAHPAAATALIVTEGARKIAASQAYQTGRVELQDASSQAAIARLPLSDGMRVLDYCAGGGGKLLAMADHADARFFAHDAYAQRMKDLPVRAKRAGVNAQLLQTQEIAVQAPFDLVFCDVPCSGSGTWRRDPDAKWRLTPQAFTETCALQQKILQEAAAFVGPEGFLAYATCSLCPSENRDQIERFLKDCLGWVRCYEEQWTPLDQCDGFFTALLQRVK